MITINTREIAKYEAHLRLFARKAYPFATKHTVNSAAFDAQGEARTGLQTRMILRNKHTVRSIRVEKTKTLQVSRQAAFMGSTEAYMERQEFGDTVVKKGKRGVPLATSYAAGLPIGQQPRTKLPRRPNKLRNIKIRYGAAAGQRRRKLTRVQRNMIVIKQAAKTKKRFVFLELARTEGIFKVIGRATKPSIKMIHDLSHKTVRTPRNPWMAPAVANTVKKIPNIYLKALKFQIERNRLFR